MSTKLILKNQKLMKKLFFAIVIFVACMVFSGASAQNVITVEHSGVSTFYQNLDIAMAHASSGDNIYLPGTSYAIGTGLIINKCLHIIGAGCNLDSSVTTGATILEGNLYITSGADSGSIEGVLINANVYFGTTAANQAVNLYSIKRCYIGGSLLLSFDGVTPTASTNILISEDIIMAYIYGGYAQNVEISKCIIVRTLNKFSGNAMVTNNIFLWGEDVLEWLFEDIHSVNLLNNIIMLNGSRIYDNIGTLTVANNLFTCASNAGATAGNGSFNQSNYYSVPRDSIFINQSGDVYNFAHNYHLRPTCVGKFAGADLTDVGIYGTPSPAKDGNIPFNPHIQAKTIPANTNSQGNLNISIKVAAQDK